MNASMAAVGARAIDRLPMVLITLPPTQHIHHRSASAPLAKCGRASTRAGPSPSSASAPTRPRGQEQPRKLAAEGRCWR